MMIIFVKETVCLDMMIIICWIVSLVAPSYPRYKDIIPVIWKAPTSRWVKANTEDSLVGNSASCGGIFREHLDTFLGCFADSLGDVSVFEAEATGLIKALKFAASYGWGRLCLESDSTSVVRAFNNLDIIPFCLRNRSHNCLLLGINSVCSHIFCERNCCVEKLANDGNFISGTIWFDSLPRFMSQNFS